MKNGNCPLKNGQSLPSFVWCVFEDILQRNELDILANRSNSLLADQSLHLFKSKRMLQIFFSKVTRSLKFVI